MPDDNRPDVLILFTDQLDPRCMGYEGDPAARTPVRLDLAARMASNEMML